MLTPLSAGRPALTETLSFQSRLHFPARFTLPVCVPSGRRAMLKEPPKSIGYTFSAAAAVVDAHLSWERSFLHFRLGASRCVRYGIAVHEFLLLLLLFWCVCAIDEKQTCHAALHKWVNLWRLRRSVFYSPCLSLSPDRISNATTSTAAKPEEQESWRVKKCRYHCI